MNAPASASNPALPKAVLAGAALLFLLLAAAIAWAWAAGPLREGFEVVVSNRWGWVTLIDLYVGLTCIATWIYLRERNWRRTLAWALALALTGNLATLAYMWLRVRR